MLQEQQLLTDGKIAELMRHKDEMVLLKHKELMYQQEEYLKQQQRFHRERDRRLDEKPDIKPDVKPSGIYGHASAPGSQSGMVQPKMEPIGAAGGVKQEVGTASFSLYGYQPEKCSYISADQLQSYEHSKMGRSQSPKKGLSVPPPLIKDSKGHSSVIVENKRESVKSSSPHGSHYQASHMSPHPQPKPAHTPDRTGDRPRSNNSSPGAHGMSPAMAHQHPMMNMRGDHSRPPTTGRSQSPLRIASPQQLSAAVMQPMDYRCSPNVNKTQGSPGSNSSHHHPIATSAAFSPAIAQAPVSLPHSSVNYTYGLITQGLVPNPIYSTNSKTSSSESQRTVSVTGTAQVPRAAQSPSFSPQPHPGTKRKGQKEGTTRKRQKASTEQPQVNNNNPLNLSVPCTTPQIATNPSPYTTNSGSIQSAGTVPHSAAAAGAQQQANHRLSGLTGFMDSFKSFLDNTVQNAFMSDPELSKQKQQEAFQMSQLAGGGGGQKQQPYKPKTSLERSCTPVTSQQAAANHDESSNVSAVSGNQSLGFGESRPANGQVDTDSDTLSAPSPPPHLRQETNNSAAPNRPAKHPNLKKAWLARHSEDDKNVNKPVGFPAPNSSVAPDGGSASDDKEGVRTCYVNCGSKSPISALSQGGATTNGPTEGKDNPVPAPGANPGAPANDESTTSASEAETQVQHA